MTSAACSAPWSDTPRGPLPSLAMLQFRVDPQGTRFKTFPAFEKFVERCREDLERTQADLLAENQQEPKPGGIQN
jgi:hypothetical protein